MKDALHKKKSEVADVEGYSRLMHRDEETTITLLRPARPTRDNLIRGQSLMTDPANSMTSTFTYFGSAHIRAIRGPITLSLLRMTTAKLCRSRGEVIQFGGSDP